jgi:hypothetical protein
VKRAFTTHLEGMMAEKNKPARDETTDSRNGRHGEGSDTLAPVIDEDGVIHEMHERPHENERKPSGAENGRRSSGSTKRLSNKFSPAGGEPERIVTMTLSSIDPGRRPNPSTVCEVCPAGVWMAAPREVKCYCRILHMFTWKTTEPTELTHCDGLAIAMEKEE